MNKKQETLREIWDYLNSPVSPASPIYRIVDEDGINIKNEQVRRVTGRLAHEVLKSFLGSEFTGQEYLYFVDITGFDIMTPKEFDSLMIMEDQPL